MTLKVQPLPQGINRNRWFGFYDPRKVPVPVPAEFRRDLVATVLRPFKDRGSVEALLKAVGRLSPTFDEGIRLLWLNDVEIEVSDSTNPSALVGSGGSMVLQFPEGRGPLVFFSDVINAVGLAVPPPAGVERASLFVQATPAEYKEAVWRAIFWNAALADSFLFQVALELILQGVDLPLPGLMGGILHPAEIGQFSLFRQGGLLGLMRSMSQILGSGPRESFERQIDKIAEQVLSGAVPVVPPWQEPEMGERPDLARSLLDDCAGRFESWGQGLYRGGQKEEARGVRSRRAAPVLRRGRGILPMGREVETLVDMIRQMNRRVAETVLDPVVGSSRVSFRVVSGRAQEPVLLAFHGLDFFGISHPTPPEIVIDRSQAIQKILRPFLRKMAELGVPDDLYRFDRFVPVGEKEPDLSALTTYLFYRNCCRQAWGFAAELEFLESIGFNSLGLEKDSPRAKMKKALETGGLALLIEKMVFLMEPEKREWAMEQARIHATVLIEAGGLPLFMRHQEGEPVEPAEIERLVSEMGRLLERLEERGEGDPAMLQVSRTLRLGAIPETVKGLRRLFGDLSHSIQKREGVMDAAIARLDRLVQEMKSGAIGPREGKGLVDALWPHIDPGTDGEMPPRLSPAVVAALQETGEDLPALTARLSTADSSGDLLAPLREESEKIRAERQQRIGAARERRRGLADQRRQVAREAEEAARLAGRRLRETRLAEEADGERRRAEALGALIQEQKRRRLEEAERQEGILRAGHASVLIHRREELSRLAQDLQYAVLGVIVDGTLNESDLDREEIELVLGGQRRTIHPNTHYWDSRRGEIEGRFEAARKRPLSERRVAEPMVEEMRQLCDAVRSEAAWIASRRRSPH